MSMTSVNSQQLDSFILSHRGWPGLTVFHNSGHKWVNRSGFSLMHIYFSLDNNSDN